MFQVLTCLKGRKRTLQPLCRLAVVQRQVDASEDIELDPDLSEACRLDRDRLCGDAGWGEGAAQECLEYHLHGETLGGGPGAGGSGNTGSSGGGKGGAHARLGLSPPCAAALFRRQMEEAEDIRFNYRLSSACAGDKQVGGQLVLFGASGCCCSCVGRKALLAALWAWDMWGRVADRVKQVGAPGKGTWEAKLRSMAIHNSSVTGVLPGCAPRAGRRGGLPGAPPGAAGLLRWGGAAAWLDGLQVVHAHPPPWFPAMPASWLVRTGELD